VLITFLFLYLFLYFFIFLYLLSIIKAGVKGIMELGDAKKGDCTMLDALIPAIDAVQASVEKKADLATVLLSLSSPFSLSALSYDMFFSYLCFLI
jgi:hypothetical protein